jgi:hypothetical protein
VQIARISAGTVSLIDNRNLWDPDTAIAYAALDSNAHGEVGVSYAFGGGTEYPSHAVGILSGTEEHLTVARGRHGPSESRWGDYLTVRRNHPDANLFAATGYTLQAGAGGRDASPLLVYFGRTGDVPAGGGGSSKTRSGASGIRGRVIRGRV